MPGDPIEARTGEHGIAPERLAQLRHELGLDQSILKQFGTYAWNLLHGDFGTSIVTQSPVLSRVPAPCSPPRWSSLCAMLFAVILGVPAGVFAAVQRGSVFDHTLMATALTGYSMPIFWWGLLLIISLGHAGAGPGVRPDRAIAYYFDPVTGFMLIDSLLSGQEGAFSPPLAI